MIRARFDLLEREKLVEGSQKALWSNEGKLGQEYLFEKRRLHEATIRKFCLGYVPSNTNHQLANRIIFPIYDPSGNLVAVSSRSLGGYSPLPVYWHESFNKSFYLYGMNVSKDKIRKTGFVTVCEGNFDVIKCHDQGFTNVVGLLGTSFNETHIPVLLRYCENVIFVFDNDDNQAGQKAGKKTHKMLSEYNSQGTSLLNFRFVHIEGANDPDEYIDKYGILSLKQMVKKERDELNVGF